MLTKNYFVFIFILIIAGCAKQQHNPTQGKPSPAAKKIAVLAERKAVVAKLLIVKYAPEIIEFHKEEFITWVNATSAASKELIAANGPEKAIDQLKQSVNALFNKPLYVLTTGAYFNETEAKKLLDSNSLLTDLVEFVLTHELKEVSFDQNAEYTIRKIIRKKHIKDIDECIIYKRALSDDIAYIQKTVEFFKKYEDHVLGKEATCLSNHLKPFLSTLYPEIQALL